MTTIRASLQLVDEKEVLQIIKKDARLTTKFDEYAKDNELAYYLVTNTWLHCIKKWSTYGWCAVKDHILKHGLVDTIALFDDAASKVIHGDPIDNPMVNAIIVDVYRHTYDKGSPDTEEFDINHDSTAAVLFLFRYPKRFSPVGADVLWKQSITEFINLDNRNKLRDRKGYDQFVVARVRDVLSELPWDLIHREFLALLPSQGILSTGATTDGGKFATTKIPALARTEPRCVGTMFGYTPATLPKVELGIGVGNKVPAHVMAVPKSYKAARIIAPEPVYRQAMAKAAFYIIEKYLPTNVQIRDQSINQDGARQGSIDGYTSTIDRSHASDTITKTLFMEIFPKEAHFLLDLIPWVYYTTDKEQTRPLYMFATSVTH